MNDLERQYQNTMATKGPWTKYRQQKVKKLLTAQRAKLKEREQTIKYIAEQFDVEIDDILNEEEG